MKEQLGKLLRYLGLTSTRFADEIGVQRSGISHILSGRNQPSYEFIIKLAKKYPQISLEWLLLGKGPMIKSQQSVLSEQQLQFHERTEITNEKPSSNKSSARGIPEDTVRPDPGKVTDVNNIQQVIFIYPDGTFKSLMPAKD